MLQLHQKNMAFMGTMITRGSGTGVVVATGMNTAMGQIANMLQNAEQMETPLQRRLEQLGKILIIVALILTALVVLAGVYQGMKYIICFSWRIASCCGYSRRIASNCYSSFITWCTAYDKKESNCKEVTGRRNVRSRLLLYALIKREQ